MLSCSRIGFTAWFIERIIVTTSMCGTRKKNMNIFILSTETGCELGDGMKNTHYEWMNDGNKELPMHCNKRPKIVQAIKKIV